MKLRASKSVPIDASRKVNMKAESFRPRSWFWVQFLQKEFQNLGRGPDFQMAHCYFVPQKQWTFDDFWNWRPRRIAAQLVQRHAPMDAPRRVSMKETNLILRSVFWSQILQKQLQNVVSLPESGISTSSWLRLLWPKSSLINTAYRSSDIQIGSTNL